MDAKVFLESSRVQVLIPQATIFNIEHAFANDYQETGLDNGLSIEERSLLYFGGYVAVASSVLWSYSSLGMC